MAWSFVLLHAVREDIKQLQLNCVMVQIYPRFKLGFDHLNQAIIIRALYNQLVSNEWSLRGKQHIVHSFMCNSPPARWKGLYGLLNKCDMKEDWCNYK